MRKVTDIELLYGMVQTILGKYEGECYDVPCEVMEAICGLKLAIESNYEES